MKNVLFFLLLLTANFSFGQCEVYECEKTFYLPIYDPNPVNNLGGDMCFVNQGDTAAWMLHPAINFNNWTKLGFHSSSSIGAILVTQPLNVNSGQTVYTTGHVMFLTLNMSAGALPTKIFVGKKLAINSVQYANNSENYIYLAPDAQLLINNINYTVGDTFKLGNNTTNRIIVASCDQNIPLAVNFETFVLRGDELLWNISNDYNSVIEIQKRVNGEWETIHTTYQGRGQYQLIESNYYRAVTEGYASNVVYYKYKGFNEHMINLRGQLITEPEPNVPYWKGNSGIIMIK